MHQNCKSPVKGFSLVNKRMDEERKPKMSDTIVLFDLDGTLTDPGEGITNSIRYSLKKYGIEAADRSTLYRFIGPPLHESYETYFSFSHEQAMEAVGYYREYYAEKGIFENGVYEGIRPMLQTLKEEGVLCLVATSKPEKYARQILEHYDLAEYFYYVAGSNMDGSRTDKAEVIAYALEQVPEKMDRSRILMVGDRLHDIAGAKKNELKSVGVLFGYGGEQELREAGADYLAKDPEELTGIIVAADWQDAAMDRTSECQDVGKRSLRPSLTTLCYIERDGKYLMMHRVKKEKDINKDKWIGVGGHFEAAETPEECLLREVKEETGLTLTRWKFCGLVTFISDQWEAVEYMCLYRADGFTGELIDCDEGTLEWVEKEKVYDLPIWEGDKIFFRLLEEGNAFFSLKLRYEGDVLAEAVLDGTKLELESADRVCFHGV